MILMVQSCKDIRRVVASFRGRGYFVQYDNGTYCIDLSRKSNLLYSGIMNGIDANGGWRKIELVYENNKLRAKCVLSLRATYILSAVVSLLSFIGLFFTTSQKNIDYIIVPIVFFLLALIVTCILHLIYFFYLKKILK